MSPGRLSTDTFDLDGASEEPTATLDLRAEGPPEVPMPGARYADRGCLGRGGMGEVRRVYDHHLQRTVAMKVLHSGLLDRPGALSRFEVEARATAALQHPAIVPVHELGRLPDGRAWFTMKEVQGQRLDAVIAAGVGLRRLVGALLAATQAVAHAHARGVIHRDLKPENIMMGPHGEVYVLDWGVASLRSEAPGAVVGTPAYMAPEQARGEVVDERADVYALGAILYTVLCGTPPYAGDGLSVLAAVRAGPPPLPVGPEELVAACVRAMARDRDARFSSAGELAAAIQDWLEGSRRRAQALAVVEAAERAEAEGLAALAQAATARAAALADLAALPRWAPEAEKAPVWARLAAAEAEEEAGHARLLQAEHGLQGALQIEPTLPEAHGRLATRYQAQHAQAEAARDRRGAARARALLSLHAGALPAGHATRTAMEDWLAGDGWLTLFTEPAGAQVRLYRMVEHNRRLVPRLVEELGTTPIVDRRLPMGSYRCEIDHPARAPVICPVEISRCGRWDGVPPGATGSGATGSGATGSAPLWLPPRGALGPGEIYVPAGWFSVGGDPELVTALPAARLWCPGFVMDRFPITNAQYLAFLDDLCAQGREEEALRHAPRATGSREGEAGPLLYGYEDGRFHLQPDAEGDTWRLDWPVVHVNWWGARAFLAWRANREGRPWRLPLEREWEKAARGVDGRWFPWGDHFDPSWCRVHESARGREAGDFGPAAVDTYPVDESPYGLRGMGGNVMDWCLDRHGQEGPPGETVVQVAPAELELWGLRVLRGGAWDSIARGARSAGRGRREPESRTADIGFRGVYPVGGDGR